MPVRDQIKSNPVQQSSRYYITIGINHKITSKYGIENIIMDSTAINQQ